MGFVCKGRYALAPIEPTDAEKYVNLQLDCMEQTYDPLYFDALGESFTARHRAERNEYLEDFHRHLSSPPCAASSPTTYPAGPPTAGYPAPSAPASTGISRSAWRSPCANLPPGNSNAPTTSPELPAGTRKLTHLYTLNHTHGTGLGQALYESIIYPDENSYLWVMAENERALSFYERLGYRNEGVYFQARGSWEPGRSVRYTRILNP